MKPKLLFCKNQFGFEPIASSHKLMTELLLNVYVENKLGSSKKYDKIYSNLSVPNLEAAPSFKSQIPLSANVCKRKSS